MKTAQTCKEKSAVIKMISLGLKHSGSNDGIQMEKHGRSELDADNTTQVKIVWKSCFFLFLLPLIKVEREI